MREHAGVVRALRKNAAASASPSVCSGAYILAEAGLLDGRASSPPRRGGAPISHLLSQGLNWSPTDFAAVRDAYLEFGGDQRRIDWRWRLSRKILCDEIAQTARDPRVLYYHRRKRRPSPFFLAAPVVEGAERAASARCFRWAVGSEHFIDCATLDVSTNLFSSRPA